MTCHSADHPDTQAQSSLKHARWRPSSLIFLRSSFSQGAAGVGSPRNVGRLAAAFFLALLLLAPGIKAPFVKDAEPQSAQWIADIVHHDHWLIARDYYGFANPKPPLFYWLSAIITKATGGALDEVHARIVSLIAAAALAVLTLGWTTTTLGLGTGWLAFFFLVSSYAFTSRATTALTDMLMTFLLFAAYCAIYPALDQRPSGKRVVLAGLLLGLALLTKGPVTLLLFILATAIFCLLVRRNPFLLLGQLWPWIMLALGLSIAIAWYVPALLSSSAARIEGTFTSENLGHFIPASMGGTGEAARPAYYILLRLLGGVLPLTPLLIAVFIMFLRVEAAPIARKPLFYQLAMLAAVVLLFSAASAKRDDYILPAIPPLAILLASLFAIPANIDSCRHITATVRDLISGAIGLAAVLTLTGVAFSLRDVQLGLARLNLQSSDASYLVIIGRGFIHQSLPFVLFEFAYALGAALVAFGLWRRKPAYTGGALAMTTLAGTLLWTAIIRPAEARTHTMAYFAREVRSHRDLSPLYTTHLDPEFSWYYGSAVWPLPREIWRAGNASSASIFLIARPSALVRLAPPVRAKLQLVLQSSVLGRGGSPAVYELAPAR
jgi:4-amino-4-deoxy-L-arabinose transferase-like glycosyltransferase